MHKSSTVSIAWILGVLLACGCVIRERRSEQVAVSTPQVSSNQVTNQTVAVKPTPPSPKMNQPVVDGQAKPTGSTGAISRTEATLPTPPSKQVNQPAVSHLESVQPSPTTLSEEARFEIAILRDPSGLGTSEGQTDAAYREVMAMIQAKLITTTVPAERQHLQMPPMTIHPLLGDVQVANSRQAPLRLYVALKTEMTADAQAGKLWFATVGCRGVLLAGQELWNIQIKSGENETYAVAGTTIGDEEAQKRAMQSVARVVAQEVEQRVWAWLASQKEAATEKRSVTSQESLVAAPADKMPDPEAQTVPATEQQNTAMTVPSNKLAEQESEIVIEGRGLTKEGAICVAWIQAMLACIREQVSPATYRSQEGRIETYIVENWQKYTTGDFRRPKILRSYSRNSHQITVKIKIKKQKLIHDVLEELGLMKKV